ncbi:hypothetical protein ES703_123178 [subsurface metagenome]
MSSRSLSLVKPPIPSKRFAPPGSAKLIRLLYFSMLGTYPSMCSSTVGSGVSTTSSSSGELFCFAQTLPSWSYSLSPFTSAVKGQHPSLQDVPAYAGLAQGMGGVTLAEVLTEEEVREILLRARQEMLEMGEVWEFSSWGKLHQYQLAGMGFRYHEGERFLVISLFYEDDGAAARDEYELRQRLGTYVRVNGLPATDYWQVSSSKVLCTHGGSVLTIECKLIWEFQRAQIVSELLLYRDIIFLAVGASDF